MPTLAVIFPPTQAPERLNAVASAAEASGLAQLWVWEDCPRTVALAGELADGLIIPGGVSPDDVRTSVRQFHAGRTAAAGPADIVVFVSVPADGPAAAAAATISEYARAGATHIAVNAAERDADLERFVGFLAHQVAPACR